MVLQALTRYYDILTNDPDTDIAPPNFSTANVSFAIEISEDGELLNILSLFERVPRGKKMVEVYRRMFVPEMLKRSGVNPPPNFLCDNSAYILGISEKDETKPTYSLERHSAFKEFNQRLLAQADCSAARAVHAFLDSYNMATGRDHPAIAEHLDSLLENGGNLVFMLNGKFVHEDLCIRRVWEQYKIAVDAEVAQCLVTGEEAPVARLHASLKGVRGANSIGATLVGFNARAYESYGHEQGMNSPVSKSAAFAYTTALNYLLSRENENPAFTLGDTTVVYWAESDNHAYRDIFLGLYDPAFVDIDEEDEEPSGRDRLAENRLKHVAAKVKHGQPLDMTMLMEDLNPNTRFYVLGLAPNAARISVRFFHSDPFEKIISRIMRHYEDLQIIKEFENQPTYLTVRDIVGETVSKKASNPKASPLLAGAVFRAVLTGVPYPAALYNAILTRVRADQDDKQKRITKIGYARAAIIKACLIRKYRNQPEHAIQEVLQMSLNESSTSPAYVLGRLFAVLEKVQIEAINPKATIKDRYFTTACASPASVFPVLLRLSQHHIAKAEYGKSSDRRIQDILNLLDLETNPIPARLTLDEQGVFILGYYHQRAAFYQKSNNETTEVAAEA
jgi:CRISPR-associated protein Csd1